MITIRSDSRPLGLGIGLQSETHGRRVQGCRSRQEFDHWVPGSDTSGPETALRLQSRPHPPAQSTGSNSVHFSVPVPAADRRPFPLPDPPMTPFTRRQILRTGLAAATGAVVQFGSLATLLGAGPAQAAPGKPETTSVDLGFIALTDAAPLIIAKEKGFFEKQGMTGVDLKKQTSWAVTRDNLELGGARGGIDGAHILSPMPYLLTSGAITKSRQPVPMFILARLNLNGQAISASNQFLKDKFSVKAPGLAKAVDRKNATGDKFKAAVTFPGGTHDLWMRYWLSANGVDPNKKADLVVIPPPQMVANMKSGTMDIFCVGEPWNERLVNKKLG